MIKLFALESIQEIPYEEPASETEGASDAVDASINGDEIIERQEELGDAICVAQTLDAIGEQVDKAPDGFSVPATKALNAALEHLCNIDFGDQTTFSMIAVEEFSTYRARRVASMESLEKIKEFGLKVWEWIKKLIKDIIASIKKVFNVQKTKVKKLELAISDALVVAEKAKAAGAYSSPDKAHTLALKYDAPGFRDKVTMRMLSTHGRFNGGAEVLSDFKKHTELMGRLENGFLRIEEDVIRNLETAMRNIFQSGKEYSRAINGALVAVTAPLSGHQIPNKRELPNGVRTYETPLVFGNESIYREAVVGEAELTGDILRTTLGSTSNTHDVQYPEAAPYLTISEIESGLHAARDRVSINSTYINKLLDAADSLDSLESLVGKIAIENTENDMVQRRARRILSVVHAYLDTRRVFANQLVSYDHAVTAALVNYCSKSNLSVD